MSFMLGAFASGLTEGGKSAMDMYNTYENAKYVKSHRRALDQETDQKAQAFQAGQTLANGGNGGVVSDPNLGTLDYGANARGIAPAMGGPVPAAPTPASTTPVSATTVVGGGATGASSTSGTSGGPVATVDVAKLPQPKFLQGVGTQSAGTQSTGTQGAGAGAGTGQGFSPQNNPEAGPLSASTGAGASTPAVAPAVSSALPTNAPTPMVSPTLASTDARSTPGLGGTPAPAPGQMPSAAQIDARRTAMGANGPAAPSPVPVSTVDDPNSADPYAAMRAHRAALATHPTPAPAAPNLNGLGSNTTLDDVFRHGGPDIGAQPQPAAPAADNGPSLTSRIGGAIGDTFRGAAGPIQAYPMGPGWIPDSEVAPAARGNRHLPAPPKSVPDRPSSNKGDPKDLGPLDKLQRTLTTPFRKDWIPDDQKTSMNRNVGRSLAGALGIG